MSQVATDLAGKHCTIFSADAPACVLIQPTGAHELAGLAEEAAQIQQHAPCDVTLVSFPVTDWNPVSCPRGAQDRRSAANLSAETPEKRCGGFWRNCCRRSLCRKPCRVCWAVILWRDYLASGQPTRRMPFGQWLPAPPPCGSMTGTPTSQRMSQRLPTSTSALATRNTRPEIRCCAPEKHES